MKKILAVFALLAMISMGYSEAEVLKCYEKARPFSGDFSADIKKFLKVMS